jgi:two-component system, OmpR family, response regulator
MRVLVVEDEERLADAIRRGLRAEGFDVEVVHDGLQGLWRARDGSYGAIVLDVMLPGMNGYKVCEQLRASGVDTPILMLTAKDGEYDEADALDLGADDFLRKPFSYVVLVARLNALARRGARRQQPQLAAGDLRFDPKTRVCEVDGKQVGLTWREAALLEELLRARGHVVGKMELLDAVWGYDYEGDANVVEVYVGYLRRKIGSERIQTVRGVGYRLVTRAP